MGPFELRAEFPFTQRDTPALRQRIRGDLARVVERVAQADPRVRALVLTGGFSRGEGTTRDDAPVNDYDLLAIRDAPGGTDRYRAIGHDLSRDLGIEVDILPIWRRRLPYVGRKLFWLDVRLGARVIAGDHRALSSIRGFRASEVHPGEPARLLGNRAAGLLLSLPGPDEEPDPFLRDLQAVKAVLAAMDATLLHRGLYPARMRDRLLLTKGDADHSAYSLAVAWKLGFVRELPEGWWQRARDVLLRAVDETHARSHVDGLEELVMHAALARRFARAPSQGVRKRAWDLLARCEWPTGPIGAEWHEQRVRLFAERAKTLQ